MSLYEFLLFVHILAAAIWLGAGLLLQIQASRADSVSDDAGGMSAEAAYESRRLLALARVDYVVLVLVILDLAAKPTGDDVALLLIMAVALAAGAVYTVTKANAIVRPLTS